MITVKSFIEDELIVHGEYCSFILDLTLKDLLILKELCEKELEAKIHKIAQGV